MASLPAHPTGSPYLRIAVVSLLLLAACGPSRVKITQETEAVGLPKPAAVYVYDFAVSASEVQLDQGGPLRRIGSRLLGEGSDPDQQAIDTGHQVADRLATDLVEKITAMGLPAQRSARSQVPPEGAVAVGGQFVSVDEGSQLRRMAIGFHQGQSSVTAQVQLYQVTGWSAAAQLLEFTASSASSRRAKVLEPIPFHLHTRDPERSQRCVSASIAIMDSVEIDFSSKRV